MKYGFGLYVSVDADGKIKRSLATESTVVRIKNTTTTDEIIKFSELNLKPYAELVDELKKVFDEMIIEASGKEHSEEPYVNIAKFENAIHIINEMPEDLEKNDPVNGYLIKLMIELATTSDNSSARLLIDAVRDTVNSVSSVMQLQILVNEMLDDISRKTPLDLHGKYAIFEYAEFSQIFTLGKKLKTQYFFRSLVDYYRFLMMKFIAEKPNVAQCVCCGRYFIPKTKKKTMYCDRVMKNGRTCKEIAPALKHRLSAGIYEVVKTFDRARQRMYKRLERSEVSQSESQSKTISYTEYCRWLDAATKARDDCLEGKFSYDEAIKIIDV